MAIAKTKHKWNYKTGELQQLHDYLFKRVEYDKVTLIMDQSEYDEFLDDTCVDDNLYASRFRITDLSNDCTPEWLFDGKLKTIIEIIK